MDWRNLLPPSTVRDLRLRCSSDALLLFYARRRRSVCLVSFVSLDLATGRIRGVYLVWLGRLRAACGQRRLVHVRSGGDDSLPWDLPLFRVFDGTNYGHVCCT